MCVRVCVCVCVCEKMCVCVHASWLKGGVAVGGANCKKVHNFQIDSQTCTDLVEKMVMSQRSADDCSGQLAKRGRGSGSGL